MNEWSAGKIQPVKPQSLLAVDSLLQRPTRTMTQVIFFLSSSLREALKKWKSFHPLHTKS